MRTTVTFDEDTYALIQRRMKEKRISFKQAVNDAVRTGLTGGEKRERWTFPTYDMGKPLLDLTHTGRLLDELDVEQFLEKKRRET